MVTIPDSVVARQAEAYLRRTSPDHLVNHCLRSYLWAAGVAALDGVRYDAELLFVSAALHDLGLLDEFDLGNPFEVDGAWAATEFASEHGWDEVRSAVVGDAVARHVAADMHLEDGPEAYLLWHGTGVDVYGSRVSELDTSFVSAVLKEYPRHGFQDGFAALFQQQATAKPLSRAAELVGNGLLNRLAGCPLDQGPSSSAATSPPGCRGSDVRR